MQLAGSRREDGGTASRRARPRSHRTCRVSCTRGPTMFHIAISKARWCRPTSPGSPGCPNGSPSIGREGAEELTALLTGCFTGMIAEIERFGGDVLKFGGDALLVLYQGTQHTERACFSTVAMRDLIARPLATSTGMPRPAPHLPGHARRYVLGIRGRRQSSRADHHRTRRHRDRRMRRGREPGPDPAVVRRRRRASTDPGGDGNPRADGSFGGSVSRTSDRRRRRSCRRPPRGLAEFVPEVQRDQISVGAPSEHRRVTTGFCKFSHTDALLLRDGPEVLGPRLQQLATLIAHAEVEYGIHWLASDVYPDGGKAILTAGAPVSHGDDEERMLRVSRFDPRRHDRSRPRESG